MIKNEESKEIIKNNVKVFVGIIIGTMVTGTGVYAATVINASDVSYSNASSGMTSENVQGAIEELYNNSKKNLDFIDETVGADFAIDVFADVYSDAYNNTNYRDYATMTKMQSYSTCIGQKIGNCMSSCMSSCSDGQSICQNKCNSMCTNETNTRTYQNVCIKEDKGLVSLDEGCSKKCSNNDTCYKSCFRKVVGDDKIANLYLTNK